jgi:hypothetical protein
MSFDAHSQVLRPEDAPAHLYENATHFKSKVKARLGNQRESYPYTALATTSYGFNYNEARET